MDVKELYDQVDGLFTKRSSLMLLWQEQAENFYPERADFTFRRQLGTDFAANLMTSYPLMCRREMGDQVGTMLRPTAKPWFEVSPTDPDRNTIDAKRWLEYTTNVQRRAMYDRRTLFTRATKEGDNDFVTFGQTCLSVRLNRDADRLLFQCWHLRDVVWQENEEGQLCLIGRKWKPTARELQRLFGAKVHDKVAQALKNNKPFTEFECVHIVVEAPLYDKKAGDRPYWSIYYDVENKHVLEEVAIWTTEYFIPRWQTVSGSQYAFSPATIAALPDARLIQSMTYTLLEAGEKITNPPMLATIDAVRSDMQIFAGGTTWLDRDYDEKMGEALRPMNIDAKGMPLGIEMQRDARAMIAQAFYLNKLTLPERGKEMTAYEVGQRIQEYIRGALPLFEPMEAEYNGALCEMTFDLLRRHGAFGSPFDMPKALQGAELQFHFVSPLHDAVEQLKGAKFLEMGQYIAEAVQLDRSVASIPDAKAALRDVLLSVGAPANWVRTELEAKKVEEQQAAASNAAQSLAAMTQGSQVVANLSAAAKDRAAAGAQP